MLQRIRKAMLDDEQGFTLIELLVVIIIIGILAAIAIPVYLNQRSKGYDAQAKSDLHNYATAEETWLTDNPAYATTNAQLVTVGMLFSSTTTDFVKATSGSDWYCVESISKSGTAWFYGSNSGLTKTDCSTTG